MSSLTRLFQQIQTPASVIQFAKDGVYEEAWITSLQDPQPDVKQMKQYVQADDYEKLIVEYIWNHDVDEQRYVLTVIQDENCLEKDRLKFVEKCFGILYAKLSFLETIDRLDKEIVGRQFLLRQPVQKVRLGIFNHWFSVGPIEMWDEGDELHEHEVLAKIKNRPEVEKSTLNYQGLAFIYNFDGSLPGPYHILKTPACKKVGQEWVVDASLVFENMKRMLV